jgi:hypothetical protein
MMTSQQREALDLLRDVCELAPDVRLGQLMAHLGFLGDVHLGQDLGTIEDAEMLGILHRHREELLQRSASADTEGSVRSLSR